MYAVFYDLETTSKNTIGQIVNYSFILVDDEYKVVDELSGLVKISRLQLPDAGAILANRTDVLKHQSLASDNEPTAMLKIEDFLSACIQRARGAVAFIGYNSSRFDLGYLRTSFIRNGRNPYFGGKLTTRDLLHAVQKAYLSSEKFRSLVREQCASEKRLSLSLQTVTRALGLLEGTQAHESREDVLLTIRLAEWLQRECGINVREYEAYEGFKLHSTARSGTVYWVSEPEYDLSEGRPVRTYPACLLDVSGKMALWINLEKFAEKAGPHCIMWRQLMKHPFFVSEQSVAAPDLQKLARSALAYFAKVSLKNYFEKSTCDIEQDIYRLDFDAQDLYAKAIESGSREILAECANPDAKVLWVRRQLAHSELDLNDPKTASTLRQYALHRYGGKLQLAKNLRESEDYENYHPTLSSMWGDLVRAKEGAVALGNAEDRGLMEALERFYKASDIVRVAGDELVPGIGRSAA
jgi:hypothetical protein